MMHDLAYLLLVGGGFMAALGLAGGLYEHVIDPLWEHWQEKRNAARRKADACATGVHCIDTRRVVAVCAVCGDPIYNEDLCYELDDKPIHSDCVTEYVRKNVWGA